MRAQITYNVTGSTLSELYESAGARYQKLIGNPEALLPHNTHIEVNSVEDEMVGTVLGWTATVHITARD